MIDLDAIRARYPEADWYSFGDGAKLNREILALVRSGTKTVSCDAVANFIARGEALPQAGKIDIATDWLGAPQLAVRTVEVMQIPFDQMTAELIPPQAEFRDLDHWREGYRAYLTRAGVFAPNVIMLVERFEVVEDFCDDLLA
ncbi:ASCH domain-containing protein [uncultured Sulfitobacter sp.]|uniref:ASCH domain-containing protein n=1 Tax=uncultured Sulfitobacter sp. TaxID=191468 RepID=UPI0026320362|nr:ASCH domain-containing protein [uncultured Sulfitobacter sp.]